MGPFQTKWDAAVESQRALHPSDPLRARSEANRKNPGLREAMLAEVNGTALSAAPVPQHVVANLRSEWQAAIADEKAANPRLSQAQAVSNVVKKNPMLHQCYVLAHQQAAS